MDIVKIVAAFLNPVYIILFLAVRGVPVYLFGVKFAYYGQVCDIALSDKEEYADNEKSSSNKDIN